MREVFLSASIPTARSPRYLESANPFLIQFAVRELVATCLGRRRLVWGGHPSITPMVHAVCKDFGAEFDAPVVLYQSAFFKTRFPAENHYFDTRVIPEVEGDRAKSLAAMRIEMLSRPSIDVAVFVGGMEGISLEHELLAKLNPRADRIFVRAPGGAAAEMAREYPAAALDGLDFARGFHKRLDIDPNMPRDELTDSPRP